MGIPDRWISYSALGKPIPGTRFVAFKVPLSEALNRNLPKEERFTPADLMELCPNLSLVVDLTNTSRYYKKTVFTSRAIEHEKIFCPGHEIPSAPLVRKFTEIVDEFLKKNQNSDGVIGVHCTHGVNRTGYFICRYMIDRMGIPPDSAFSAFKEGRGYGIERVNYIRDLQTEISSQANTVNNPDNTDRINEIERTRAVNTSNIRDNTEHAREWNRRVTNKMKGTPQWNDSNRYVPAHRTDRIRNRNPYSWRSSNYSLESNECVNSGVDFGYGDPVCSRYVPYRSRYDQRGGYHRRERLDYPGNSRNWRNQAGSDSRGEHSSQW